jgi:hypothetical protein
MLHMRAIAARNTICTDADRLFRSIADINKHCLNEFRKHWTCLDNNNQQLWQCRPDEFNLNKCVFNNLVCPAYSFHESHRHNLSRLVSYQCDTIADSDSRNSRKSSLTHPRARHPSTSEHDRRTLTTRNISLLQKRHKRWELKVVV